MFAAIFKEARVEKQKDALRKEYKKALSNYRQAKQNFNYADSDYIEKSIYDLISAELYLNNTIAKSRSEYDKLVDAGTN